MDKEYKISAAIFVVVIGALILITLLNGIHYRKIVDFDSCKKYGGELKDSYPAQCSINNEVFEEKIKETPPGVWDYFADAIKEIGLQNLGGIPPEGFTPNFYLEAFPGIKKQDFNGAAAVNGKWVYADGILELVKKSTSESSTEGMLTNEGMKTLLENLKIRLRIEITTTEEVDALIQNLYELKMNTCTLDSRKVEFCAEVYEPVCGKPAEKTFSNSCFACQDKSVYYWLDGEC